MQLTQLPKSIGQSAIIALVACGVVAIVLPLAFGSALDYRALLAIFAAGTVALTLYEAIFRRR